MLNVKRDDAKKPLELKLSGIVDERASLVLSLGKLPNEMRVNCRGITRINSAGIKLWREYWHGVRKSGAKIEFAEISPAVVAVMGSIIDFVRPDEVVSLCVPFVCVDCKNEIMSSFTTAEIKNQLPKVPRISCGKCGADCELDDIAEDYFSFLSN